MTDSEKIELLQAKVRTLELEVLAMKEKQPIFPTINVEWPPWPPYPDPITVTYSGSKTT